MVGHDEGGQQLRIDAGTLPFVKCEHRNLRRLRGEFAAAVGQGDGDGARHLLGEVRKLVHVQQQLDVRHAEGIAGGNIVERDRIWHDDRGHGGNGQRDPLQRGFTRIFHGNTTHHAEFILIQRVIDDRRHLGGDGDRLLSSVHGNTSL